MEAQRIDRKRKIDHYHDSAAVGLSLCEMFDSQHQRRIVKDEGWDALQPILENDVLQAKIPTTDAAFAHLVRWFRIIVHDAEKLRLFRQWVIPSSDVVKQELDEHAECTFNTVSSSTVSSTTSLSSFTSLASLLNKKDCGGSAGNSVHEDDGGVHSPDSSSSSSSSTGSFTPDSNPTVKSSSSTSSSGHHQVLQQLLQQQQQQIVLLQQLQKQSPPSSSTSTQATTISIFPRMGRQSTLLTVTLKGGEWHSRTPRCECVLGLTTADGTTTTAHRIPGGTEGDLLFIIPQIHNASSPNINATTIPVVVHLTLCSSPTAPIVCLEPFVYTPCERLLGCSVSDEDLEDMGEETPVDGEEEEGSHTPSPPPQALPPLDIPNSTCPTPKQMMNIRERMLEHMQQRGNNNGGSSARLTVLQQPSVRVVWKNRRLDTPFKLKVECVDESPSTGSAFSALSPSKLFVLAIVADHKGRLQIDAAENFAEDFSAQGIAHFSNLRMTKGTWGKEWTITFAAVVKGSLNNPVVTGVSTSCPIVVKTRKNPQIRHTTGNRVESSPPSPPHVSFVERKSVDTPVVRAKRHRVEDLLDHRPPSPPPRTTSHSEDMASLLAAAELKQQEQLQEDQEPEDVPCLPLMSKQNDSEHSFANFQNLMSYLEEIRVKRQISLAFIEQPQPKRDSKILIVKKGKPFRVPFQVQLRSTAIRHNPQHYVCVAVVRNDKGEEVAVRNSEVPFDWKGIACFAGLMVMKGTWGKTVQLTFEARWAAKRSGPEALAAPPSWTTQRMLVVSETSPTQLMCYTKDKKAP